MSKGASVPDGVRYFSYKASGNKGKNHPDAVNAGQSQVAHLSGSHPAISKPAGGSDKIAGVHQHSGKEHFTNVRHLNAFKSGPAKRSGADAHPDGVRKFKDASV